MRAWFPSADYNHPRKKVIPKIRADTSDPRSSLSWKFSALSRIIIFLERKSFQKLRADTSDPRSSLSWKFSALLWIIINSQWMSSKKLRADTSDPRSSLSWKFSALLWIIINSQWTSSKRFVQIRPIRGDQFSFVRAWFPSADYNHPRKKVFPKDPCRYVRSAEPGSLSWGPGSLPRIMIIPERTSSQRSVRIRPIRGVLFRESLVLFRGL